MTQPKSVESSSLNDIYGNNSTTSNSIDNRYILKEYLIEPLMLFGGIIFNLFFIYIIVKRKKTSKLKSNKPFRFIFITILICDTWYLIDHINIWYHSLINKSDLTSINGICQFHSYFSNFFTFLNEIQMLIGSILLIRFVSNTTKASSDIYNSFIDNNARDDSIGKSSDEFDAEELDPITANSNFKLNQPCLKQNDQNKTNFEFLAKSSQVKDCALKNKRNKSGFKIMINVLDHFRNKKETIYYDMLLREKFVTWLSVFLCMYMLSFTLWIKVINIDSDEFQQTCKTSILLKQIFSNLTISTASNSKVLSTCPSVYPVRVCIIHSSFKSFHKIFQLIVSVLRSFTLFINSWSSIYFCIKFRYQYLRSIYTKFKYPEVKYNFKYLNFFSCCHLFYPVSLFSNFDYVHQINEFDLKKYQKYNEELDTFLANTSQTTRSLNQQIVPFDHIISQKEATQSLINRPTVSNFEKRKHQLLLQSNYDHFHFVRHYAINIFIYSLLISPSVFRNTYRNFNDADFGDLLRRISVKPLSQQQQNGGINAMSTHVYDSKRFQDILNLNKPTNRNLNLRRTIPPSPSTTTSILSSSTSVSSNSTKVLIYDKHRAKSLLDLINDPNEIKTNEKNQIIFDEFLYITELMAHSTRFLIYIMFSANIKLYFRFI
jgi:hypothetical protein